MDSENPSPRPTEEMDGLKICASDTRNELQLSSMKSESFVVEMERFPHLGEKEPNANSRPTLQRNLSRKGSAKGDKKINSMASTNERDAFLLATSPRAPLHGSSTPEKLLAMATDQPALPLAHHQITIINAGASSTGVETKWAGKKFSFRRSSSLAVDPRRILIFFATLSSVGTILLIYFTLSMSKINGDGNFLD